MNFPRFCVTAFVCILAAAGTVCGQSLIDSLTTDLNIRGMTTTMDPETGIATVTGDVNIRYGDMEMRCGSAQYNQATGEVVARDGVTIWKAGMIYRGDSITYNSITGGMSGHNVISGMPAGPGMFIYRAADFQSKSKLENRVDATDVHFTSHDVQNPNFHLSAKDLAVLPGDRVTLHSLKIYGGNTPLFWLPMFTQPILDDVGFSVTPGYGSRWGAFLLTQYSAVYGDHTLAKYKVDLRSKRGVAAGVDLISLRHRANGQTFGMLKIYGARDTDGNTNVAGTQRFSVPQDRYRINFQHRVYLPGPDTSTWYLDFDLNKISDYHFYEDFFFNDFQTDREPDNQVSLIHTDDAYVATLMAKFKMNDFYRTTTRLPELSFDFVRRPLFGSGIFHQGTITAGVYNEVVGRQEQDELLRLQTLGGGGLAAVLADPLGTAPSSYLSLVGRPRRSVLTAGDVTSGLGVISSRLQEPDFARFHTYHELLYPKTYLGWLNVTPRIGAGMTSYGSIDGSITGLQNFTRGILQFGLDVSFKVVKTWSEVKSEALGIDGIRHVLQPYVNYSYLDAQQDAGLPAIDRLSPTTRPRSIDVPMFTAVDSLASWNVARIGFRNLLQTRRDYTARSGENGFLGATDADLAAQTYTWAGMNTYVDVFAKDPEYGRDVSNLYNEIFWNPVPWISLRSDLQLPISSGVGSFKEFNNFILWMPNRNTSVLLGHQYLSEHPYFAGESSRIVSKVYARLSENYGINMSHIYEADDGTMEFQSYGLTRDLSSWLASIGVMARDNRNGVVDVGILLTFTLKDFPQLGVGFNYDPTPNGQGGNGQ